MRSFITALQFLTRIHLVRQENLTAEDFGRSTRFFPLVGAVLGALYLLAALACLALFGLPSYTGKAVLVVLPFLLTGGLHADGFMDTMDGLFSGRSRERMLEIMKDSRTGSFGVAAFAGLLLLNWSLLLDLPAPCFSSRSLPCPSSGAWPCSLPWHTFPMRVRAAWGRPLRPWLTAGQSSSAS